jgi:hypothetical protein
MISCQGPAVTRAETTSAIPSASWKAGTMTEVVEGSATRGFYIDR